MKGAIQVVPWDDGWPDAFRREERRLRDILGTAASAIHHIGSTSVQRRLAHEYNDAEAYQAGKRDFISRVERLASARAARSP